MKYPHYVFSFLLLAYLSFDPVYPISSYTISLIVVFDGISATSFESGQAPTLFSLKKQGTVIENLRNVFITNSVPNLHSIVTGVYTETHGIISQIFYDPETNKKIEYGKNFYSYSETPPLWTVNEKKGESRYSCVIGWPGGDFPFEETLPTHYYNFDDTDIRVKIDTAFNCITNETKPANLVFLHFGFLERAGMQYGTLSPKFKESMKLVDEATSYILHKLETLKLKGIVNVFFMSSTGLTDSIRKNAIYLEKRSDSSYYFPTYPSPVVCIYPKEPRHINVVLDDLMKGDSRKFNVYEKNDLPDRWHLKNNKRAPPIIIVAEPPYYFRISTKDDIFLQTEKTFGLNGYDNKYEDMNPFFVALGPDIKKNTRIGAINIVDLYPVWGYLAGFDNYFNLSNGTLIQVKKMLMNVPNRGLTMFRRVSVLILTVPIFLSMNRII